MFSERLLKCAEKGGLVNEGRRLSGTVKEWHERVDR